MPAAAEINEPLIRDYITRAVSDVFKTMLGRIPTFVGLASQPNTEIATAADGGEAKPFVVGTVGFIGEVNGLIYLYLDESFARVCTRQLLGMNETELTEAGDDVINDAIGELTNMTVGGFKNGLCDAGFPCKLTIPSILRGSNFSIEPISSASRYTYHFDSAGHKIVTDILLKTTD
jgi:chemotaxis protein CheX